MRRLQDGACFVSGGVVPKIWKNDETIDWTVSKFDVVFTFIFHNHYLPIISKTENPHG